MKESGGVCDKRLTAVILSHVSTVLSILAALSDVSAVICA
jgi:hypothetical protein